MADDRGVDENPCDPKPAELLELAPIAAYLFGCLRSWFDVGPQLVADLSAVGGPTVVAELQDPELVAGFAMRRLQALHLLAQPGVRTTTDVVVHTIDGVMRALVEAPKRHMSKASDGVDWDREWATLDAGMFLGSRCPEAEATEFRACVDKLLEAREAIIQRFGAEIRILA